MMSSLPLNTGQVITVSSCGVTVNYQSSLPLIDTFRGSTFCRYFPQYSCDMGASDTPYSVVYIPGEKLSATYTEYQATLNFPWGMMMRGETILYAGYPFIEAQRQARKMLTCHAAAYSFAGCGVLLLGKEGAGKSSVLLRLCQDYGAKLIGNDLCVIGWADDKVKLLGGTNFFHFRRTSAMKSAPELARHFSGTSDGWIEKMVFPANELGVDVAPGAVDMVACYIIHVDETQDDLYRRNADDLPTRLYLNENFSRYIRSTATTVLGGHGYQYLGYIPSLDNIGFFSWRQELLTYLFAEKTIEYISGKSSSIAKYLASSANPR